MENNSNKRNNKWVLIKSFFFVSEPSRIFSISLSSSIENDRIDGDEKLGTKGLEEIRKIVVAIFCNNIYKVGEFGLKPSEATIEFACLLPQTFLSARQWIIQILRFITLFSNGRVSTVTTNAVKTIRKSIDKERSETRFKFRIEFLSIRIANDFFVVTIFFLSNLPLCANLTSLSDAISTRSVWHVDDDGHRHATHNETMLGHVCGSPVLSIDEVQRDYLNALHPPLSVTFV